MKGKSVKDILYSRVNPEEITVRAFKTQERMLKDMADRMSEEALFDTFKGRMGNGLARALAAKCKGR